MTVKEHVHRNWVLALPVMLSQVGHVMVGLADSLMVGRLGVIPLASVSLASGVYSVFMLFGIGASYGMTPFVAKADGQGNVSSATEVLKHGLMFNGVLGIFMLILSWIASVGFNFLDQDPEVLAGAIPYFLILGVSSLPLMVFQTFRQFTEGLSLTRQAMMISIAGNVINVILNYILIFGVLNFKPIGLLGAAWSTLITRFLMSIAMASFVLFHHRFKAYRKYWAELVWRKSVFKALLRVGLPSGLQYVFEVGAFSAAAIMTGWLGPVPLAAHQIVINLSAISYMAATGLSAAAAIRIANQLGRKDFASMRRAGHVSFVMAILMMVCFGACFLIFNETLPAFYINDSKVIYTASSLLLVAAIFQVSDGVQTVGLGVLRGLTDVKVPTLVTLFSFWIVAIPAGYLLGIYFELGVTGIWMGLLIGLTLAAIMHFFRFLSISGLRNFKESSLQA